jgi:hypothetical protein
LNERDLYGDDLEFARVRDLLAGAPLVEPRPGALERIVAAVAADPEPALVVELYSRRAARRQRWLPRVAAAAVVIAIVGAVVGGVGGDTRIPAVGELVESHQAAASEAMPETAAEMPMEAAHSAGPSMPEPMEMMAAYVEAGDTIHLVYADGAGGVVSVFRQDGDTDLHDMGAEGDMEMMGDTPVWTAVVADMHVAVVDGDGYVWTVVADHHDEAMMTLMTGALPSRSPSLLDRLVDLADMIAEPWRFGG